MFNVSCGMCDTGEGVSDGEEENGHKIKNMPIARLELRGRESEGGMKGREMKTKIALKILAISIALMCVIFVMFIAVSPVVADRGVIVTTVDIPVFEPGQKAIVAWNGSVETLIISTDVNATANSTALEILPLPSNPVNITVGDSESFNQTQNLIEKHAPTSSRYGVDVPGSPGINITFQEKIGAHSITVVEAHDAQEFVDWVEDFLGDNGIEYNVSSNRLEPLVVNYIDRGIKFFVFDLIELNTSERSVEPIVYQFQTDFLYYPLEISSLASGNTEISLFTVTKERIEKAGVSTEGFDIVNYTWKGYGYPRPVPVEFEINEAELENISSCAAELFELNAWLTAWRYNGSIEDFESDFVISASASVAEPPIPFLIYGWVNYSTGEPVNNPKLAITNLNTSEVFDAETDGSSNYYQVLTSSWSVSTDDVLHFNVSDNDNVAEFNRSVTQEDRGGIFDFNITLKVPEVPTTLTFDTGKPANPYPSISGTHNGTITPYVTIYNVSTLYTYPCSGTGGHTEYVAFYAESGEQIANASWKGYQSDYHNISFDTPFDLHAGVVYTYEIRTGSYPQIHHADELPAKEGMGIINCTSFVDANGRSYNNRIPAIRLEGESAKNHPVHNIDTGEDFAKIQDAIDDADTEHRHTITVDPGTYNETVTVTKSLTIKSTSGNPADTIVQAEYYYETTFTVTADYVNINGFTVGWSLYGNAIWLSSADHCTISNNNVSDILLDSSRKNSIVNNCFGGGISIRGDELSHYNTHTIEGNTKKGRPIYYYKNTKGIKVPEDAGAVILANCTDMTVKSITASFGVVGIKLAYTTDSKILNNIANSNGGGIYLYNSSNNTIANNTASNNMGEGIRLSYSSNNRIMNNNLNLNGRVLCGIHLQYSNNNTIANNNITNHKVYGIYLDYSNNNKIYRNNFINDFIFQAYDNIGTNAWNNSYPSGGNYWIDYEEKYKEEYGEDPKDIKCGPNQDQACDEGDGIWDKPYKWIGGSAGAKDNYPLIYERTLCSMGVRNPAAVYCTEMGYEYKIEKTENGEERGICVMPDNEECDAWAFYSGECGREFSYCAKMNWSVALKGEKDSFATNCTTCVLPDGTHKTISELLNLSEKCSVRIKKLAENRRFYGTGVNDNEKVIKEKRMWLPDYFDWRNKDGGDWMTPVKDQGSCGSCWAFSAVGIVEPVYNIFYGNPNMDLNLSEEYLVSDCYTDWNCCGGWHWGALFFIKQNGITDEACFPYVDASGCTCDDDTCDTNCNYRTGGACSDATCSDRCPDWSNRLKEIDETGGVLNDIETIKESLIEKGPLSIAMGMGDDFGGYFDNGIYRCTDDSGVNHAVIIAGYSETEDYWIVKNCWGSSWNGDGYFKVGYGECSIEELVYYANLTPPTITTKPATDVTDSSATLHADFTIGACPSVDVWFRYKKSSEGTWTDTPASSYTADGSHSDMIIELASGTQYDFKALLKYDTTELEGGVLQFTTNIPPIASFTYSQSNPDVVISISQPEGMTDYISATFDGVWQSFKPIGDTIVAVDVGNDRSGYEIWVTIEDSDSNVLGTSELATSANYYPSGEWTHLEFASPVRVTPGETYKIVGHDNAGWYGAGIKADMDNPYPDGYFYGPYGPYPGYDMIFQVYSYEYPYTIEFTDTSTDSDGWIEEWYWDFGDETHSTEQNPAHQYTASTYIVTLNVTDNDGATDSVSGDISVGPLFVQIRITHHYGNTSAYNNVHMFDIVTSVGEGSTPLGALNSIADVTMQEGRVYSINGLTENPPDYWYLYINGIPAPNEDIDSYQLRDGEVTYWDYTSMINAGEESAFRPRPATDYPEPFLHGYNGVVGDTTIVYPAESSDYNPIANSIKDKLIELGVPNERISIETDTSITQAQKQNNNLILIGQHSKNDIIQKINQHHEKIGMPVYFDNGTMNDDWMNDFQIGIYDCGGVVEACDNPYDNLPLGSEISWDDTSTSIWIASAP